MWAIGGGADARVPGPQTPLGLWLREVWEPPHTTAGWAVGGVKVRPESKWATVKNAPQPTNSRPQCLTLLFVSPFLMLVAVLAQNPEFSKGALW